jgi:RHS repeat-associated protein
MSFHKIQTLTAKIVLMTYLFNVMVIPVSFAQELLNLPTNIDSLQKVTPIVEKAEQKQVFKEDIIPEIVESKKSITDEKVVKDVIDPDEAWKSKIDDPKILKKIQESEDKMDLELEKFTAKDKDGNEVKLSKKEKRKDKQAATASLLAARVANDGVTVSPQQYKNVKPSVDQTTGALIYKYDFNLPDGIKGLTPKVGIRYNSQSLKDGSPYGYGWDTNIPYIEIMNKTGTDKMYADNYFTHSELGEMRSTGGNSYGLRVDEGDFLNFTLSGNSWTVKDKQGTTYTYGLNAATRQDNPSNTAQVYRWYLEKVQDVNGNSIDYTYYKELGQIYISQIKYVYNGATPLYQVNFNKVATASRKSAAAGFMVENKYLINNVQVLTNNVVTREYNLAYTAPSVNSPFAQVTSVTELGYAAGGNTSNVASFQYSGNSAASEFTESTTFQVPSDVGRIGASSPDYWTLIDYNNDGLPDIVKCTNVNQSSTPASCNNGGWKYYKNNGSNWVLETTPVNNLLPGPAFHQNGYQVNFTDLNGDKTVDVVVTGTYANNYVNQTYLHNNTATDKGWTQSSTVTVPNDIGNIDYPSSFLLGGNMYAGYKNADLNGDGLNDYFIYSWNQFNNAPLLNKVFLNKGATITPETINFQNTQSTYLTMYSGNGYYPESTLAETNNDGLVDILKQYVYVPENKYHYNNGKGFDPGTLTNDPWYYTQNIQGAYMSFNVDLNGDGYADYLQQDNTAGNTQYTTTDTTASWATKKILINQHNDQFTETTTGPKFTNLSLGYYPDSIYYPCCNLYNRKPLYFLDVNGDGLTDILEVVNKYQESPIGYTKKVWMNTGKIPGMMTGVTLSTGGSYKFTYKSSAQYRDASNNSLNPDLPFSIQTLNTMTQNDANGNNDTSTYTYSGGSYYFNGVLDRKFAGFEKVTETRPDNTKFMTYYHQGNDTNSSTFEYADNTGKIGKIYRVDNLDASNNIVRKIVNKYESVSLGNDRIFTYLNQTVGQYDVIQDAVQYIYNTTNGNLTDKIEWGEVSYANPLGLNDLWDDKRTTSYTYLNNPTTNVTVLNNIQLKDQAGNKVSEKIITYDGGTLTKGNPTNIASWVSGTTYNNIQKSYNTAGQVVTDTDARGKVTSYTYDAYNLFPTTITKPLALSTSYQYNYAIGKPTQMTNENNRNFLFTYDGLGRVLTESIPSDASPTTQVLKTTYVYGDVGNSSQKVYVQKITPDPATESYTQYDGLGRAIRNVRKLNYGYVSAQDTIYDNMSRVSVSSLPYIYTGSFTNFTPTTIPVGVKTNYTYDALDRLLTSVDPTGTTTYVNYASQEVVFDKNSKKKRVIRDRLGRVNWLFELNNGVEYLTGYVWRVDDKLLKITDALGNIRNFTYDGEGKRLTAEDLHTTADTNFGSYTYQYDAAGNLTQKTIPDGRNVVYTYDDNNRVLTEKLSTDASPRVTYVYDTGVDNKGKLYSISNVLGGNEAYNYTPNGNVATENISWTGISYPKVTNYKYDTQQNLKEIIYPDNTKTVYTYNQQSLPNTISYINGAVTTNIIPSMSYTQMDLPDTINLGNGAITQYTYDVNKMHRLTNKTTGTLQNLSYTYDNVGNILTLTDTSNTATARTATYTYDDLYRLTNSADSKYPYNISYTYNAIGNITNYAGYIFNYAQTGKINPHAITSVTGNQVYTYDNNGNVLTDGLRTNTWDYRGQLTTSLVGPNTASNGYKDNGQRVITVDNNLYTFYSNKYYSEQNNATTTKSIFLGNTLIATVVNNTPSYNLTDHLGTVEKTVNGAGTITSLSYYKPFGVETTPIGNSLQPTRKYIGEYNSPYTGYSYLNARYLEPNQSQFISQDPVFWSPEKLLTDPQSMNSYSYANNNPINFSDKNGLCAACIYGAYNLSNYINNSSQSSPNYVREANFALRNPVAAYQIGSSYDNGTGNNISTVSSNFAINLRSGSSQGSEGTERNAIRHLTWQAITSRDLGIKTAKDAGNAHENNPFVNLSNRNFSTRSAADQTVDLLNNQIGRSIYSSNPSGSNLDYAKSALDYMYKTGAYTISSGKNGGFSVVQTKISQSQYNSDLKTLSGLKNNGLK